MPGFWDSAFEKCGNPDGGVSKKDLQYLLRVHHEKLLRDLESNIWQHLEYCFQNRSSMQTAPLVEKELDEEEPVDDIAPIIETETSLKFPVDDIATVVDIDGRNLSTDQVLLHEEPAPFDEPATAHDEPAPSEREFALQPRVMVTFSESFSDSVLVGDVSKTSAGAAATSAAMVPKPTESDASTLSEDSRPPLHHSSSIMSSMQIWQMPLHRLMQIRSVKVESNRYSKACKLLYAFGIGPAILLNSAFVGFRIAFTSGRNEPDGSMRKILDVGSLLFCVLFTGELLGKLLLTRKQFFTGKDKGWNFFDGIIVVFMLLDEVKRRTDADFVSISITWISALRVAHLWKSYVFFSFKHELHLFQLTLQRCLWDILVHMGCIALCTYLCALALTEASTQNCLDEDLESPLCRYFGSLGMSTFSLYGAVFDGLAWGTLYHELRPLGFFYIVLFMFFVTCMSLVLLNSVVAVVVTMRSQCVNNINYASKFEKTQREEYIKKLTEIFEQIDVNTAGSISLEEMRFALQDPKLVVWLDTMKIDIDDVEVIFELLDRDGDMGVDLHEFLFGCLRINGAAKGIDLVRVLGQVDSVRRDLRKIQDNLDRVLRIAQLGRKSAAPNFVNPQRSSTRSTRSNKLIRSTPSNKSTISVPARKSALTFGRIPSFGSTPSASSVASRSEGRSGLRAEVMSWKKGGGNRIPQVEQRALCLNELFGIRQVIELLCRHEVWRDSSTDEFLDPKDVNLYHFNQYIICPETLPKGAIVTVEPGVQCEKGDPVEQSRVDGDLIASGFVQEVLSSEKLRITVTWGRFTAGIPHTFQIYGSNSAELTEIKADHFSYKELISQTPMNPDWFCSHWWGESIINFVNCVQRHVELQQASASKTGYWVCAYANDQHDIGLAMGATVENSSFMKAIRLARGTLLLLDPNAKAFSRIWCDFEIYTTLTEGKKFDVAVVAGHDQRPRILLQQPAPEESSYMKMKREGLFPVSILAHGMRAKLEDGDASVEADKTRILESMAAAIKHKDREKALELALAKANATLNAYFAIAAWPLAVSRNLVNDFDRRHPSLNFAELLQRDQPRRHLALTFSHIQEMSDEDLQTLAEGMPPRLEVVELRFKSCVQVTDEGFMALMNSITTLGGLKKMHLDFTSCVGITDSSLFALAVSLPPHLKELGLDFGVCTQISKAGVRELVESVPDTLQVFSAKFKGTQLNQDFDSVADVKKFFRSARRSRMPSRMMTSIAKASRRFSATDL